MFTAEERRLRASLAAFAQNERFGYLTEEGARRREIVKLRFEASRARTRARRAQQQAAHHLAQARAFEAALAAKAQK